MEARQERRIDYRRLAAQCGTIARLTATGRGWPRATIEGCVRRTSHISAMKWIDCTMRLGTDRSLAAAPASPVRQPSETPISELPRMRLTQIVSPGGSLAPLAVSLHRTLFIGVMPANSVGRLSIPDASIRPTGPKSCTGATWAQTFVRSSPSRAFTCIHRTDPVSQRFVIGGRPKLCLSIIPPSIPQPVVESL